MSLKPGRSIQQTTVTTFKHCRCLPIIRLNRRPDGLHQTLSSPPLWVCRCRYHTQAEIRIPEHSILDEWSPPRWDVKSQGTGGGPERPEHHKGLQGWLPASTPSEGSLDTNLDSDTDELFVKKYA